MLGDTSEHIQWMKSDLQQENLQLNSPSESHCFHSVSYKINPVSMEIFDATRMLVVLLEEFDWGKYIM